MKKWFLLLSSFFIVFALFINLSHAQEYTPDSNTVALWHFNEGSGNLAKDETGRFNGTINGAIWSAGKYGNALSFDGVDDSVVISSNTSEGITNQLTLEAWIYPTKYGRVVGRYAPSSPLSYLLTIHGYGQIVFYINSTSSSDAVWSISKVPLNNWTHIAVTYNGTAIKIYINGILDSITPKSLGNIISTTAPIRIGNDGFSDVAFGGIIDEVRISNIVRYENQTQPPSNETCNCTDLTNQVNELKTRVTELESRLNNLTIRVGVLETAVSSITQTVNSLVNSMNKIFIYLSGLPDAYKKSMVCTYMKKNNLTSYSDFGLSCKIVNGICGCTPSYQVPYYPVE